MSLEETIDILKIWSLSISTFLINLTDVVNSILSSISLAVAIIYTSYKLYLLHKQNKNKKNGIK